MNMEDRKTSKYTSTPETRNFAKVCRLFVDLLRDVLWEALTKRILPEDIPEIVRQKKSTLELAGRMTDDQYRRICKPGGMNVSFEDFDISLLYILLRHLPLKPKVQGSFKKWGSDDYPDEKHIRETDDIERIRIKRNQLFAHAVKASLSKNEFEKFWTDMEAVVERFDRRLSTDLKSEMEVILKDDKFEEEYIEDFKKQKEYDLETRQLALEAIKEAAEAKKVASKGLEKIKKQIDETGRKVDEASKKVDDLQKDVKEKKKDAEQKPNDTLQNMLDKTREKLEDLKSEKAFFHQTKEFNQAKDLLLNKPRGYTVFLSGNPGEGKTTAGHMLLLEMQNSRKRCLILNEPGDVRFVSPDHVDIIFVDDIFGNVCYDDHLNGLWKRHYEDLKKWKKSKKVSFIFTSRELILRECRLKLDKEDFYDRDGFILLSSKELNEEEKAKILVKQLNRNKVLKESFPLKNDELAKCYKEFTSPFGFPLCCKVFSSSKVYLKQKSKFFSRPLKALEAGINELWETDANKPMFIALAAVWMSNEKEESSELDSLHRRILVQRRLSLSNFDTQKLDTVARNLNVYLAKTFSIDELFEKLNGVYLIHHKQSSWQPEGYAFSHEVIEEAFGRVLAWTKPNIAVQYGSIEFLVNNTSTATTTGNDDETSMNDRDSLKISLAKSDFENLFQRLMKSLKNLGDEFVAVHHDAFEDSNFLNFFLEKLSGTTELKELIIIKRGFAWGFTRTSFLKEALEQNLPKVELVSRILKEKLLDQIDDQRWVQEQKQSMFSAACRLGSYQLYKLLVQESVAITSDSFIRATSAGNREIVEDLFQRADLGQERSIYDKCLALASQGGFMELVQLFVEKGANLDTESPPKKETPLYQAISKELEDIALFLITKGADVEKTPMTKVQNTCLHLACQLGQTRVVDALLNKRDIRIDFKNKNGVTPLQFALTFKSEEAAKLLIDKGCDINLKSGRLDKTPLHISSEMGLPEITRILLKKGADPMAKDKKGHSPIHYASMNGHKDIVDMLIEKNADQAESRSLNHRRKMDKKGLAPIHYAARGGCVDVVRSLIESGVNTDVPDMYGRSPLYLAARYGHQNAVTELLKVENIDVNYKEKKYGFTPLHIATERRHASVVEKLCQHRDIRVNLSDKIGRTPLHIASTNGDKLIMTILLRFHSDPRCVTENLDTPLHLVKNAGVAAMLLGKDSSVIHLRNKGGKTPLEMASQKGANILKVFEESTKEMEVDQS
ncbi:hypothetical protein CHS0354_029249 [Potamilus streckersoni]|uniref:DZIP3-like HEPN domain-containing protein n=1 Tax=Potamilus streckersoni TaxID=2493646 RepID=A0AAE0SZP7_9BIVA|nr:hypothetical protein CHS0354_029249 [Potamilus streckersoni]